MTCRPTAPVSPQRVRAAPELQGNSTGYRNHDIRDSRISSIITVVSDGQNRDDMRRAVNAIVVAPALQILRVKICNWRSRLRQSGVATARTRREMRHASDHMKTPGIMRGMAPESTIWGRRELVGVPPAELRVVTPAATLMNDAAGVIGSGEFFSED